ncbi:b(0,+)-type amino acid transporter 1-like isoform X2 [Hemibagrus wyckioides]|uniref:b(0,+)-type amino acid transporter 1-like isoform X2 n=1 Tax=Hemibagrus wyckioides TaxID=337641 RepID=UPI00266DB2B7|nr:b(0,+)-type amino acid transporter 1-like isoform X2 [Hemibagrus wyckioides]
MAFIFAFISVLIVQPSTMCGQALSFAHNAVAPFYYNCVPPTLVVKSVAACGLVFLATVNCLNVRSSMAVTTILMATKFLALLVISIGGVVLLIQGNTGNLQNSFEGTNKNISVIGMAFYQCLWAYDGWSVLNTVREELEHPERKLCDSYIRNQNGMRMSDCFHHAEHLSECNSTSRTVQWCSRCTVKMAHTSTGVMCTP